MVCTVYHRVCPLKRALLALLRETSLVVVTWPRRLPCLVVCLWSGYAVGPQVLFLGAVYDAFFVGPMTSAGVGGIVYDQLHDAA